MIASEKLHELQVARATLLSQLETSETDLLFQELGKVELAIFKERRALRSKIINDLEG